MKIVNSIVKVQKSDEFASSYILDRLCEYGFDVIRWAVVASESDSWVINVSHLSA